MHIAFHIPGAPVPKARPRARRAGSGVHMYTDRATADWERAVALVARAHARGTPIDEAVSIHLRFTLPRPKTSKYQYPCHSPGDVDNFAKAVLDGLQLAGVLKDDRRVVDLVSIKRFGNPPGVDVVIADPDTLVAQIWDRTTLV